MNVLVLIVSNPLWVRPEENGHQLLTSRILAELLVDNQVQHFQNYREKDKHHKLIFAIHTLFFSSL